MRIAVIGAGIAGLVAAASLQRDGHDVTVYEQREEPNADGAGLTLFGNAFAALDAVGLGDTVRAISDNTLPTLRTGQRTPDGTWLTTIPAQTVGQLHSLHRITLHETLLSLLEPGTLHTSAPAVVSADGRAIVHVAGTPETFDLVLAADGLRSRTRQRLGLDAGLRYSGYTAWRGVTQPGSVDLAGAAAETWGSGSIFGIVPLPEGQMYWFGTLNQPAGKRFADEPAAAAEAFAAWHHPIPEAIAATAPEAVIRHDIYDLEELPKTFGRGRTVLLGDAAHAMLPNLGQGAGQGIEDAVTLSLLLRSNRNQPLGRILARYSAIRRRRTLTLWRQSRLMARMAQASGPIATRGRNLGMRLVPPHLIASTSQRFHQWDAPVL
ncbi:FAD-dependent monooxygenase [Enteractinococcus fodinae]|uniref:2-polyprenyl-6-methoxyphenol hydroxylase-like FAD-dependent oxidoreductase n=1 Tax=Enteractinococcus fodinae TaxID=684663 RepID=A0ABU2B1U2_9MICC|nr:FAD-dependent oxidoreductase [Enteractinococcus fodinae]MDR7347573.1 2-polyprenyl-6-methoxyphenol hydroxylase-like FAD-dependent oxidoreductase [Enteractinococcus fodinae]